MITTECQSVASSKPFICWSQSITASAAHTLPLLIIALGAHTHGVLTFAAVSTEDSSQYLMIHLGRALHCWPWDGGFCNRRACPYMRQAILQQGSELIDIHNDIHISVRLNAVFGLHDITQYSSVSSVARLTGSSRMGTWCDLDDGGVDI